MDDGEIGGDIGSAELLRGGETEEVVVLVDRAAHGAEAVVAVGQRVRHGKFLQAARDGGLQNADISNVVRDQVVEAELHLFAAADVVAAQNAVGDGLLAVTGAGRRLPALPADGLIP